jgi:hypothetical protein
LSRGILRFNHSSHTFGSNNRSSKAERHFRIRFADQLQSPLVFSNSAKETRARDADHFKFGIFLSHEVFFAGFFRRQHLL